MPSYRYELRQGDEVIATGHLNREHELEAGDRLTIGASPGSSPALSRSVSTTALIVQLLPEVG